MDEQMGMFTPTGEALKEEAISRVEANASRAWLDAAWDALLRICAAHGRHARLTSDDVWIALDRSGVAAPHEPRALGAVMRRAVAEGVLFATADFRPSDIARNHRRPVRVYEVTGR